MKDLEGTDNQTFIELVDRLKKDYGYSQSLVAKRIGVGKWTISDVKNGRNKANRKMLEDLLEAFPELQESNVEKKSIEELRAENDELKDKLIEANLKIIELQDRLLEALKKK